MADNKDYEAVKQMLYAFIDQCDTEILDLLSQMIATLIFNQNADKYTAMMQLIGLTIGDKTEDWLNYTSTQERKQALAEQILTV